jgi:hypothetical protein
MDDIHELMKKRLVEILKPVPIPTGLCGTRAESSRLYEMAPDMAEFGEDPLDALVRHLCSAITEREK